jgi:hypothetical protein
MAVRAIRLLSDVTTTPVISVRVNRVIGFLRLYLHYSDKVCLGYLSVIRLTSVISVAMVIKII